MDKLCKKGRNFVQVYNSNGLVRECSWVKDGWLGNLLDNSLSELYHGAKAESLRKRLLNQDYSDCCVDGCPYLMTGEIRDYQTELGEIPEYPEELHLAFENMCNYRCISCTVHNMSKENDKVRLQHNYEIIEEKLRQAMPYAKRIGANGMGELFVSKRTLRLLSEWKPVAPPEECSVLLETNGSLFDEEHWKQIENLGKYNLTVAISIMSFEAPVYQRLSGVKYPIKRIEDNLRFVKKLREKRIINQLTIATVVQAENFRTLPDFVHKSIEEFGADFVRLRPYDNWGGQNKIEEFFMNIRNPKHPWYGEYQEIMSHPYLRNPKVHNNSGGKDSYGMRAVPYELSDLKWKILTKILDEPEKIMNEIAKVGEFAIYGNGNLTACLVGEMKSRNILPKYIIDGYKKGGWYKGIRVCNMDDVKELQEKEVSVIITPVHNFSVIKSRLEEKKIKGRKIPIWEIVGDDEISDRLRYINRI